MNTMFLPSPRPVTRGESTTQVKSKRAFIRLVDRAESPVAVPAQQVGIDWLNATFHEPAMGIPGLLGILGRLLGCPVAAKLRGGMLGFEERHVLSAFHGGAMLEIGAIGRGGDHMRGRWLIQLTGQGCKLVRDWEALQCLLEGLAAKITRVDLALDWHEGQYSLDDALVMYEAGGFTSNGRPPSSSLAGDWLDHKRGRTLYVGSAKNGKMLRVYEKGRQLGDESSPWVRYEVQLGNRDRVIPLDVLTLAGKYFAGCYPALALMVTDVATDIATEKKSPPVSLAFLLHHAQRCYGKVLHQAHVMTGVSVADLIEEVRIIGAPKRLATADVVVGIDWQDVCDEKRRLDLAVA